MLTFLVSINVSVAQREIYFVEQQPTYVSYSTWLLTLSVDVESYSTNIRLIKQEVDEFYKQFQFILTHYNHSRVSDKNIKTDAFQAQLQNVHVDLAHLMWKQVDHFDLMFTEVIEKFNILRGMTDARPGRGRKKRGIFPFGGKILNFLFSIPTNANLKTVKKALANVKSTQSNLIHVVENSVSIINMTHEDVKRNRDVIIELQNVSQTFQMELDLIVDKLGSYMPEVLYLELVTRLNNMFHSIFLTMNHARDYLTETINNIQFCTQGYLPINFVTPLELATLLQKVKDNLPPLTILPHDLQQIEMMSYYKYISPLVLPARNKIHIVLAIPLINERQLFRTFDVVNLPLFKPDLNVSFMYDLEAMHLAVSADKAWYGFLDDKEMRFCSASHVCKLTSPLYSTEFYPSCLLSLYKRDKYMTSQYCKTKISSGAMLPVLKYLDLGRWVLSTPIDFNVIISCEDRTYTLIFETGISTFELGMGCRATSSYFKVPTFETGKISSEKELRLDNEIQLNKMSPNILETTGSLETLINQMKTSRPITTTPLDRVAELPMAQFQQLVSTPPVVAAPSKLDRTQKYVVILSHVILVLFIILLAACCVYQCVLRRKLRSCVKIFERQQRVPTVKYDSRDPETVTVNRDNNSSNREDPQSSETLIPRFTNT